MLAIHHPLDDLLTPGPFFFGHCRPVFRGHDAIALAPRHRVVENEKEYILTLPLPGMRPDDLKLSLYDGILSIEGETKLAHERLTASHRLRLPSNVDFEAAAAAVENGVLTVLLPKRACAALVVADTNDALPTAGEEDYIITLALPGMRPSDLKLTCEDGLLCIDGETKTSHHYHNASHRKRLPVDADFEAASAAAENGILTVQLPKKAHTMARELPIRTGSAIQTATVEAETADAPMAETAGSA